MPTIILEQLVQNASSLSNKAQIIILDVDIWWQWKVQPWLTYLSWQLLEIKGLSVTCLSCWSQYVGINQLLRTVDAITMCSSTFLAFAEKGATSGPLSGAESFCLLNHIQISWTFISHCLFGLIHCQRHHKQQILEGTVEVPYVICASFPPLG